MKKRLLYLSVIFVMIGFAAYGQTVTGTVTSASDASALPGCPYCTKIFWDVH